MSEARDIAVAFGARRCIVCGRIGPQRIVTVSNLWCAPLRTPFSLAVEVCSDDCAARAENRTAEIRPDAVNWE
jgi:hypothetical protein